MGTPHDHTTITVMVFGVFDILHPGHLFFLESAKREGDRLVVVVTHDARVKSEKGKMPVMNLEDRMRMLSSLRCVDEVVPGDAPGLPWTAISSYAPDVICIGHDQQADHPEFHAQLENCKVPPRILRIGAHDRNVYASSKLRLFHEPDA